MTKKKKGELNLLKLHKELTDAGITILGVRGDGEIDFDEGVTDNMIRKAEKIMSAHNPSPDYAEARVEGYNNQGVTIENMVVAMFDAMEGDTALFDELREKRKAVKLKIKKPKGQK